MVPKNAQRVANVLLRGIRSVWVAEEQEKKIKELSDTFDDMAMGIMMEAERHTTPHNITPMEVLNDAGFLLGLSDAMNGLLILTNDKEIAAGRDPV